MRNFDSSTLFILFCVLFFAGMLNKPIIIGAFVFYMIYKNSKKNKERPDSGRDYHRQNRRYSRRYERPEERPTKRPTEQKPRYRNHTSRQRKAPIRQVPKNNPFRSSGLEKFRDYDYEGAIEDFKKALQINNNDIAVHFNLACSYSLTEQKDKALYHLDRAVGLGFKDFDKIRTHDALAFLRIQDEFEDFEKNGFRLTPKQEHNIPTENSSLLDQLSKLAELRERGLLSEEEFISQKKKLLG